MSNINNVVLSGNLTRDVELRHTTNGTAVCNLGLAVNRSVKKDDGEWEDVASFFDITVFGGRAEMCARKLNGPGEGQRASFVTVSGRLEQQRWEAEDGTKRSKVVVIAQTIEGNDFFKKAEDNNDVAAAPAADAASAPADTAGDDDIPF